MYRIIFVFILLIILYFLLRSALRELQARGGRKEQLPLDKNQMVQDPVCHVFVPRGAAVTEVIGGQTYCFCGRNCADKFQKQMAG